MLKVCFAIAINVCPTSQGNCPDYKLFAMQILAIALPCMDLKPGPLVLFRKYLELYALGFIELIIG